MWKNLEGPWCFIFERVWNSLRDSGLFFNVAGLRGFSAFYFLKTFKKSWRNLMYFFNVKFSKEFERILETSSIFFCVFFFGNVVYSVSFCNVKRSRGSPAIYFPQSFKKSWKNLISFFNVKESCRPLVFNFWKFLKGFYERLVSFFYVNGL